MNEHPQQPQSDGTQPPAAPYATPEPTAAPAPPVTTWESTPPAAPYGQPGPGQPPYGDPQQPYGAAPYAGYTPPGQPAPGSGGTSGFAIASLIFGIFGGILLSVIFGFVALNQIKKHGKTGRGLAIAGLVLSACWVLLIVGIGVFAAVNSDSSTTASGSTGSVSTTDDSTSVEKLKAGDCINGLKDPGTIEDLPVVSCALPHEGEIFAVFSLPAGSWPGVTAVQDQAEKGCNAKLKSYVKKPDDNLEVLYLHPLEASWSRDRGVTCVATDAKGTHTGSIRD